MVSAAPEQFQSGGERQDMSFKRPTSLEPAPARFEGSFFAIGFQAGLKDLVLLTGFWDPFSNWLTYSLLYLGYSALSRLCLSIVFMVF